MTCVYKADIGGQMGLSMGVSLLTICEFLHYLALKCNRLIKPSAVPGSHVDKHQESPTKVTTKEDLPV